MTIATLNPITASSDTPRDELMKLMDHESPNGVNRLPILGKGGKVLDLLVKEDFFQDKSENLFAVLMAGGFGTRLSPLTKTTPKPMLKLGEEPLMERTIKQLKNSGIREISITTHYHSDQITNYFKSGEALGVRLKYINEDNPLGTAGALRLMEKVSNTLLVLNGDIVTNVNFRSMLDYHRQHGATMTVASKVHSVQIPYGVLETDGVNIHSVQEKPVIKKMINAGIYLLEPEVIELIPKEGAFQMTELVSKLIKEQLKIVCFPIHEYWLDIGQMDDYLQAIDDNMRKVS